MRKMLLLALLALSTSSALTAAPPASAWEIGPVIRGKNYSMNMPLRPAATREGWSFDFPVGSREAGHVHYVTFNPGSLEGASRIIVRYRIRAQRGTRFIPQEHQDLPGTVSLVLQRASDNWSARGRYDFYRWYAPAASVQYLAPGERQMVVSLNDPNWGAVMGTLASANPGGFQDALRNTNRMGLVFGSHASWGHGVFATAPAKFELLSFRVE